MHLKTKLVSLLCLLVCAASALAQSSTAGLSINKSSGQVAVPAGVTPIFGDVKGSNFIGLAGGSFSLVNESNESFWGVNAGGMLLNIQLNGTPAGGALNLGNVDLSGLKTSSMTFTRTATGAIARSLQDILDSGYAMPEDFGAVGNGTTDDSAAIQKAVNAAREVVFAAKTYRVSTAITFGAGQQFEGQGIGKTTILLDDGVDGFTSSSNFTGFRCMTIRGSGSSHLGGRGIALGNNVSPTGNTCDVESVEFQYCAIGFYNGYYDGVSLRSCVLHANAINIKAENNVGPMGLIDDIINDATGDGILAVSANIKMRGGNLNNNGWSGTGYAIHATGSGSSVVVDGVQFEIVANGTAGAAYCYVDFNNGVTIANSIFQDGGVNFVHAKCYNGCLVRFQNNSVSNNPNTSVGPILEGHGTFDARSADFNGYCIYNGAYNFRLAPWHVYDSGDTLPTASATSDAVYGVANSTSVRLFTKRQISGTYSYVGIDGTLAALDTADVAHGGTNLTSYTAGDLLYATGATTLTKLAKGSDGQVLTIDPTTHLPVWAAPFQTAFTVQTTTPYNFSGSTTLANISGLTISNLPAGTYSVIIDGAVAFGAGGAGIKWDLHGGTAVIAATANVYNRYVPWASIANQTVYIGDDGVTYNTALFADGESWTSSVPGAGRNPFRYSGTVTVSTGGSIIYRAANANGSGDTGQLLNVRMIFIKQ